MEILFKLYDPDPSSKGLQVVTPTDTLSVLDRARLFNEEKWGIYWCPNMNTTLNSKGAIERKANLVRDEDIRSWYCDIDNGTHAEQWDRIRYLPIKPTMIVKSKNGFHLYWFSVGATVENFSMIEKRIIGFLDADKKAKDLVRLLRYPSFNHWKDPNDPFRVSTIHKDSITTISEKEMMSAFPMPEPERAARQVSDRKICERFAVDREKGADAFQIISGMDQMKLLKERLSGTAYVNSEVYDFSESTEGKYNMSVNGKDIGCFINENGEIIADKFYGNNIINWLKWPEYGHDMRDIYTILKDIVPEAFN